MCFSSLPIIDFHCDLLSYLSFSSDRSAVDQKARCSLSHLQQGQVKIQVFAVYTKTLPGSVMEGQHQLEKYREMLQTFSHLIQPFSEDKHFPHSLQSFYAFENASGFCEETELMHTCFSRLEKLLETFGPPLYISLTWNGKNRFGGGSGSTAPLSEEGKELIDWMNEKKIAIDLSHASDPLIESILNLLEQKKYTLPILASHSNARAVQAKERNLPDELAKEIFRKNGVIGLNFYQPFVGQHPQDFAQHIAHWLEIGGENGIAFGADFFYENDFSFSENAEIYFNSYNTSACYPRILQKISQDLKLSPKILEKLAFKNGIRWLHPLQKN